jgi:hypothetical protein
MSQSDYSPIKDRSYFHLVYATRHPRGVEVFKEIEKKAFVFQDDVRAEAEGRSEYRKTKQRTILSIIDVDQPPSHRAVALRERYLKAAVEKIDHVRVGIKEMTFDDLWGIAMSFPLVWESDVKNWIAEWQKEGRIKPLNLAKRQKPKRGQNIVLEFTK